MQPMAMFKRLCGVTIVLNNLNLQSVFALCACSFTDKADKAFINFVSKNKTPIFAMFGEIANGGVKYPAFNI